MSGEKRLQQIEIETPNESSNGSNSTPTQENFVFLALNNRNNPYEWTSW